MRTRSRLPALALLTAGVLVGAQAALATDGGGTVGNTAPTVPAFAVDAGIAAIGATVVFSSTVHDDNLENDIQNIRLSRLSGPWSTPDITHTVTTEERAATTEPASFDAGNWKVWSAAANDGKLQWKYRHTFSANTGAVGTYVFRALAKDEGATYTSGPAADLTVVVGNVISVFADPVDATGAVLTGAKWGGWSALPGAANVNAANYLKVQNNGNTAAQAFTLDFTGTAFSGADGASTIPLDGNVRFAWFEDTTPSTTAPNEGTYAFGAASAAGSLTPAFTGTGNIVYITYQIVSLPSLQKDQAYSAAFTATAV